MAGNEQHHPILDYPSKRTDLQRVYVTSMVLALLMIYILFAVRMFNDPAQNKTTDFIAFYAAGRIAQQQGYPEVYNLDLQRQVEEGVLGARLGERNFLLYNHPPYIIPILASLVSGNYKESYLFWMVCLSGLMLASLGFLTSQVPVSPKSWRVLFAGSLLIFPVFVSIAQGQDTAFILLGISIFMWGMHAKHETLAGLSLSLLTLHPQMALFFIIPLWFWSRRAFWAYVTASAVLVMLSYLMIGWQGLLDFLRILQISSSGDWFGMSESSMLNLLGLSMRVFPALDANLARQAAWALFLLAAAGAAIFFTLFRKSNEIKFGLVILAYTLTSPHLHYHDLSLLLIPGVILVSQRCQQKPAFIRTASVTAVSISLVTALTNNIPLLYYSIPYLLEVMLIYILISNSGLSKTKLADQEIENQSSKSKQIIEKE